MVSVKHTPKYYFAITRYRGCNIVSSINYRLYYVSRYQKTDLKTDQYIKTIFATISTLLSEASVLAEDNVHILLNFLDP